MNEERERFRDLLEGDQHDPEVQYELGRCYLTGTGVEQNGAEAEKWLRRAAEQGHSEAAALLAAPSHREKPRAEALTEDTLPDWCLRAEEGDVEAQFRVASYFLGCSGQVEQAEAERYLSMAAGQGHPEACLLLAKRRFSQQKPEEAVKLLRNAADCGLWEAAELLGDCCSQGTGTARDEAEAERRYIQAAERGGSERMLLLALRYAKGDGVPESRGKAYSWVKKARDAGCPDARERFEAEYGQYVREQQRKEAERKAAEEAERQRREREEAERKAAEEAERQRREKEEAERKAAEEAERQRREKEEAERKAAEEAERQRREKEEAERKAVREKEEAERRAAREKEEAEQRAAREAERRRREKEEAERQAKLEARYAFREALLVGTLEWVTFLLGAVLLLAGGLGTWLCTAIALHRSGINNEVLKLSADVLDRMTDAVGMGAALAQRLAEAHGLLFYGSLACSLGLCLGGWVLLIYGGRIRLLRIVPPFLVAFNLISALSLISYDRPLSTILMLFLFVYIPYVGWNVALSKGIVGAATWSALRLGFEPFMPEHFLGKGFVLLFTGKGTPLWKRLFGENKPALVQGPVLKGGLVVYSIALLAPAVLGTLCLADQTFHVKFQSEAVTVFLYEFTFSHSTLASILASSVLGLCITAWLLLMLSGHLTFLQFPVYGMVIIQVMYLVKSFLVEGRGFLGFILCLVFVLLYLLWNILVAAVSAALPLLLIFRKQPQ